MPTGRWFSTIAITLLAVLSVGRAMAQTPASNMYTVTGVDVDATGSDPIKAREQGIRDARRRALDTLVSRMVAEPDRGRVPSPDDAQLESMVRGVEFVRERTASNRYVATLNVVFAPERVKPWLSGSGVKVVETVPRPALVVPLWKGRSGVEPFDDRNAWREAWRTLDSAGSA